MHIPNDVVNTAVVSGKHAYLGGSFTGIGPASGGGIPFDAATGAQLPPFPRVPVWCVRRCRMARAGCTSPHLHFGRRGPRAGLRAFVSTATVAPWNPNSNAGGLAIAVAEAPSTSAASSPP
jgi:hypothetical protein